MGVAKLQCYANSASCWNRHYFLSCHNKGNMLPIWTWTTARAILIHWWSWSSRWRCHRRLFSGSWTRSSCWSPKAAANCQSVQLWMRTMRSVHFSCTANAPNSVGRGLIKWWPVCLSVCCVPRPNSRTERPRKPKIVRMEAHHHMGNLWTYLEFKKSKVKVTRPITAVTDNSP